MSDTKDLSRIIVDRLRSDADFRMKFQEDPLSAMKICGVPDEHLPKIRNVADIDFVALGIRLGSGGPGGVGPVGSLAVACVVV